MAMYNPWLAGGYPYGAQPFQPQAQPAQMTLPTIHADIIQIGSEDQVRDTPVAAGAAQMFITRDESMIIIKTGTASGYTLDHYDKRPPAPPAPSFDPAAYVTREELEKRLSGLSGPQKGAEA